MVFQQPNPFPKSIYDNVAYGPRLHGVKGKAELDVIVEQSLRQSALWEEVKDFLKKSALSMSEYEKGGTFVMKVPASGFSPFLSKLEKVKHEELQRSIQGQDVSEEYVDLESRLKAKQLMETQYIDFMKKATKPADLVQFANQLGEIQESIERIKGRMRYIDQNVSFSTVELRLYETEESLAATKSKTQGPLGARASEALQGSLKALSVMFQWLVVILAAALPVLIIAAVVAVVVIWLRRKIRRRQPARPDPVRLGKRLPDADVRYPSDPPPAAPAAPAEDTDKDTK